MLTIIIIIIVIMIMIRNFIDIEIFKNKFTKCCSDMKTERERELR